MFGPIPHFLSQSAVFLHAKSADVPYRRAGRSACPLWHIALSLSTYKGGDDTGRASKRGLTNGGAGKGSEGGDGKGKDWMG